MSHKKCTFFKVVVKKISTTTISGHSILVERKSKRRRRKKITVVVVRRGARSVLYTLLLHYLAVFGGVLDDHRHFCVWFLFYFSSLV